MLLPQQATQVVLLSSAHDSFARPHVLLEPYCHCVVLHIECAQLQQLSSSIFSEEKRREEEKFCRR
jgi:hypothetical protein